MNDLNFAERIRDIFSDSIQTLINAADALPEKINHAGSILVQSILNDNKILSCGNGGSGFEASRFASKLLNRFEMERPPLPALALNTDKASLSSIANDYDYSQVFAKQIQALGRKGDVLLAITSSGNSSSIIEAIAAAQNKNMAIIALTGNNGGRLRSLLKPDNIEISVPGNSAARVQECHQVIIHALCDMIDMHLFGL
ncbi:MAG: SIS domain-containing protein [Francisellaceae bacterium]